MASNSNTIKFYDFIDSKERESKEAKEKKMDEHQKMMKDLFLDLDKENTLKLHKADIKKYIQNLAKKSPCDSFKKCAAVSEEAFDDVWYEFGISETGLMSWHKIKPFMEKLVEHEARLAVERKEEAEERARRI